MKKTAFLLLTLATFACAHGPKLVEGTHGRGKLQWDLNKAEFAFSVGHYVSDKSDRLKGWFVMSAKMDDGSQKSTVWLEMKDPTALSVDGPYASFDGPARLRVKTGDTKEVFQGLAHVDAADKKACGATSEVADQLFVHFLSPETQKRWMAFGDLTKGDLKVFKVATPP